MVSSPPIMVDATPPTPGQVNVNFFNVQSPHDEDVVVRWEGFEDRESGILQYELAVGTQPNSQDVIPFSKMTGSVTYLNAHGSLEDGKFNFFQIKVTQLYQVRIVVV